MKAKQLSDKISRFLFEHNDVRGELVSLSASYQQAIAHQGLSRGLNLLLGDFLAAASLLSESMKFEGVLTLQARGDGEIPLVMAEATHRGEVRGIIKAARKNAGSDKPSLTGSLGNAVLSLTIDPIQGERYQGIVPLKEELLADCITHYFQQSEQLPSKLWLFSNETHCGGLMLQSLPKQKSLDASQTQDTWQTLTQLSDTLSAEELFSLPHEELLYRLYNEFECRVFPAKDIHYQCSCSRSRSENAIASLSKEEAIKLVRQQESLSIDCQFCGQQYRFDENEVSALFAQDNNIH